MALAHPSHVIPTLNTVVSLCGTRKERQGTEGESGLKTRAVAVGCGDFKKGLNVVSDPGRVRVCCEEGSRDSRLVRYSVDSSPELVHRRHETPVVAERPDEKARALRTDKGDCWCCKHRVSENLQKKNVPDTMFAPNVSEGL